VLLVGGNTYSAIFLAVWAVVVVGMVDNIVKPYVMKGDIEMHGGVLFFALIGGLAAFGMVGLLLGPLAVALFLALLRIYRRDYGPT
jgi:predicted PurR-regulated permease PerM